MNKDSKGGCSSCF